MKLIIDVNECTSFTVGLSGVMVDIEVTNVPEDRQWKIDELRSERDRANENVTDVLGSLDKANKEISDLKRAAQPMNKIQAIKKVRGMTSLSLKESKDLVFVAGSAPWERW
jgi:ribosomal protein L7/L12